MIVAILFFTNATIKTVSNKNVKVITNMKMALASLKIRVIYGLDDLYKDIIHKKHHIWTLLFILKLKLL